MSLLAGIDLSTKRLDAALIPLDQDDTTVPPVTFRSYALPELKSTPRLAIDPQTRSIARCAAIREGMRELLWDISYALAAVPAHAADQLPRQGGEVTRCVVETPTGMRNPQTQFVLHQVYGACLASIPPHIQRAVLAPHEWRSSLGLDPTKDASIRSARRWLDDHHVTRGCDEHEAEALLIALAGREFTWRVVEGAA